MKQFWNLENSGQQQAIGPLKQVQGLFKFERVKKVTSSFFRKIQCFTWKSKQYRWAIKSNSKQCCWAIESKQCCWVINFNSNIITTTIWNVRFYVELKKIIISLGQFQFNQTLNNNLSLNIQFHHYHHLHFHNFHFNIFSLNQWWCTFLFLNTFYHNLMIHCFIGHPTISYHRNQIHS